MNRKTVRRKKEKKKEKKWESEKCALYMWGGEEESDRN